MAAAIALSPLPGCSHNAPPAAQQSAAPLPPCTTPEPLRISLRASPQINPGEKGEPLATVIRIYQLKGTGKLQGASFDDMLDRDREVLGDELAAMTEVTINPGETLDPPVARNAEAAFIGAVALFRRPAGNTWRTMRKLPPPDPQHCHAVAASSGPAGSGGAAAGGAGGGAGGKAAGTLTDNTVRFSVDENRVDLR